VELNRHWMVWNDIAVVLESSGPARLSPPKRGR
jgi:hypothetical protein